MNANDYPISFPYDATSPPYSLSHPHRGDDRACPVGTPILIGGTTIGYTGDTGIVTGPHLHIQEWKTDYGHTRKPENSFIHGVVTNIDLNGSQGDGSFGKFITIQTDDGWNSTYCHLSAINVQIGQEVGNMDSDIVTTADVDVLRIIFSEVQGVDFNDVHTGKYDKLLTDTFVGQPFKSVLRNMFPNPDSTAYRAAKVEAFSKPSKFKQVGTLYMEDK